MTTLNRIFLMGRLSANPELVLSKNGNPYVRLRVATNRYRANTENGKQEITDSHMVFVWGREAERCHTHLQAGAMVFVEGVLQYWREDAGRVFKSAIHAENVQFMNIREPTVLDIPQTAINHNAVAHPA